MKTVFRDPELQEQFDREGYVVVELMSEQDARTLREKCLSHLPEHVAINDAQEALYLGTFDSDDRRRAITDFVGRETGDALAAYLDEFSIFGGTLMVKVAQSDRLVMHQHAPSVVDIFQPTVNFWCTLDEVGPERGALRLVPRSHRLTRHVKTFDTPNYFESFESEIEDRFAITLPMRPGQGIFFDNSLLHGSEPNASDDHLVRLFHTLLPQEEPFSVMKSLGDGRFEAVRLDTTDHTGGTFCSVLDDKQEGSGLVDNRQESVTADEFAALLENGSRIAPGFDPIDAIRHPAPSPKGGAPRHLAIFASSEDNAAYDQSGYVRRQVLSSREAAELRDEILALRSGQPFDRMVVGGHPQAFSITEFEEDLDFKRKLQEIARDRLSHVISDLLPEYEIHFASIFVKPPGAPEALPHNDWNAQAENTWPTINAWIALEDIDGTNGAMCMLERSHGMFDTINGPHIVPSFIDCEEALKPEMTCVPTSAGEAVIFDSSSVHGSMPNLADHPRHALRLTCLPRSVRAAAFRKHPDAPERLEIFSMSAEELTALPGHKLDSGDYGTSKLGECPYPQVRFTYEEVMALLRAGDRIRAGEVTMMQELEAIRSGAGAGADTEARSNHPAARIWRKLERTFRAVRAGCTTRDLDGLPPVTYREPQTRLPHDGHDFAPYPATEKQWTPFGDEKLDSALRNEGYATFSFLSAEEVDSLAEAVASAENTLDTSDVHIPTDFQLSAFNNNSSYKERIYDAVWANLRDKVESLLPDYEPLVINVFDKPVSDAYDPVPIHQNPSFVDEPEHRSVSIWIPFDNVDRSNGTVGVLPGSHGRFNRMRSGNMAHEDVFADVQAKLESELFVPVDLKKGEALALDDSIIHWSYPNVSDRPRKAVQLIMVPRGVPHIYYYYDEETGEEPMMDLYEVDKNFFFGFNCKARPETLKQIDRVPYVYRPVSEDELLSGASQR